VIVLLIFDGGMLVGIAVDSNVQRQVAPQYRAICMDNILAF